MAYSIEIEAQVQPDGMLHLSVPEAQVGERVKVVIEEIDGKPVRVFGLSRGRGQILPGFDDPVVLSER